jgi:hypothetical protein
MIKNFTFLCYVLLFTLATQSLSAQSMVFKIAAPASVSGTYLLYRSAFGPTDVNPVPETPIKMAAPALGCTPLTTSLKGTIGFVDRGDCTFLVKVKSLQDSGAVAVIICNNLSDPTAPTGTSTDIKVKSFLMEKDDCDKIKLAMAAGTVNGSIVARACEPVAPPNTIWGAKTGEGDFKGGLNGWTITTPADKGFKYSVDGDCVGPFLAAPCLMATGTICNGAVTMHSAKLDVDGVCQSPCKSSIISPNIDVSKETLKGLVLQFDQLTYQFRSDYYVTLSYDNGLTWPDTISVNDDVATNTGRSGISRISLCGANLSAKQIRLQFVYDSDYYFWGIDDVFLINEDFADPQVNTNFWAVPPMVKTPRNQVSEMVFLSDIKNNGVSPSPNTILTASVSRVGTGGALTALYSQDNAYGSVAACEQIENVNFAKSYVLPELPGTYQLDYRIKSDKNKVAGNDLRSSRFIITENTFANALTEAEFGSAYLAPLPGGVNTTAVWGADIKNFSVGNSFYFPKGSEVKATEFKFGVGDNAGTNKTFSAALRLSVYKIDEVSADGSVVTKKTLVGMGLDPENNEEYFVENTTPNKRLLKFKVVNLTGGSLRLADKTEYMFIIHVTQFSGAEMLPLLSFNPGGTNATLRWSYTAAQELGLDQAGVKRHYGTVYSADGKAGDDVHKRTIETRLFKKLYSELVTDLISGADDLLDEEAMSIAPNPASTEVMFSLNLAETSKKAKITIMDITGRTVLTQSLDNVKKDQITVNTSKLHTGIYVAKIETEQGFLSKKLLISNN